MVCTQSLSTVSLVSGLTTSSSGGTAGTSTRGALCTRSQLPRSPVSNQSGWRHSERLSYKLQLTRNRRSRLPKASEGQGNKPEPQKSDEEDKAPEASAPTATEEPTPPTPKPADFLPISKEVIEVLKTQVFGFDTFFVTGQESYQGGVLFKGNVRGTDTHKTFEKIKLKLKNKYGDQYELFLLEDPQEERPVAVVIPKEAIEPPRPAIPEGLTATLFGLTTLATVALRNGVGVPLEFGLQLDNVVDPILAAWPSSLVTLSVLLGHEAGHWLAAKRKNATLGPPYLIPGLQLGTFGGITQIKSILPQRADLLDIAAAGPALGLAVSAVFLALGVLLPPLNGEAVLVQSAAFHDSFLVGGLAKLLLGDALQEGSTVAVNPVALAAWAGLLINALQLVPAGELDGGRIALAIFGRRTWSTFNLASLVSLGIAGIFNDLALYWVVLIAFLQRGPIPPQADELTAPSSAKAAYGIGLLALALLIMLPYPIPFSPLPEPLL